MPCDVSSRLWHDSVRARAVSACAGARARQLLLPHLLPQLVLPPRLAGQSTPCQLLGQIGVLAAVMSPACSW